MFHWNSAIYKRTIINFKLESSIDNITTSKNFCQHEWEFFESFLRLVVVFEDFISTILCFPMKSILPHHSVEMLCDSDTKIRSMIVDISYRIDFLSYLYQTREYLDREILKSLYTTWPSYINTNRLKISMTQILRAYQ